MEKFIRFVKNNPGFIGPMLFFAVLIIVGAKLALPVVWGIGSVFMIVLIVALIITLKNYK